MGLWSAIYRKKTFDRTTASPVVAGTPTMPRRGWFARTFLEPVERFLAGVARTIVRVVAIVVGGIVALALIGLVATIFLPEDRWRGSYIVSPATRTVESPKPITPSTEANPPADKPPTEVKPGMVWVDGYTRKDGVRVKGYWRKK